MDDYLSDILLALSVIGAPIIFGTLLYYGTTISERRNHKVEEKQRTATAPEKPLAERERRERSRAAERPARPPPEPVKRRTGTDG
ncbi:MAG: hypothetical protein JSR99_17490 [Proteobacteria bacterium]|nr:hypothetical protein [Pseudomonadota bacterium]